MDDLPPQNVVSYYESVVKTMGDSVRDSVRLFMVPGMHHCFGGTYPGAYQVDFDPVQAVRAWKASGHAPDQIVVQTSGQGLADAQAAGLRVSDVSQVQGQRRHRGSGELHVQRAVGKSTSPGTGLG